MDFASVVFFILVVYLIYQYSTFTYKRFSQYDVKYLKPIPFFGSFAEIAIGKNLLDLFQRIHSKFSNERYYGAFDLREPKLFVRDPELIKLIGLKESEIFQDHNDPFQNDTDPLFSNMLITLKGQKWKTMRAAMTPVFTTSKIKAMLPFMEDVSNNMISYLDGQFGKLDRNVKVLEIESKGIFNKFANDVIASCAFGLKLDSYKDSGNNVFYKMGEMLIMSNLKGILKYALQMQSSTLYKFFKLNLTESYTRIYFTKLMADTIRDREVQGTKRLDMVHLLMQVKKGKLCDEEVYKNGNGEINHVDNPKKVWTDNEITAQALIFFFAGFESISTLGAYALYELATHQDVQQRLYEELHEVEESGKFSYDTLMHLKYLDIFISECLRLHPTLPIVDRVCTKAYVIPVSPNDETDKKYKVFPNESVCFPIYCIHRDPQNFTDPLKFDPERFSDENKGSIKPYTYMPFGVGPRHCIGQRFALMEEKCLLFYIVTHYKIVPTTKTRDPGTMRTKFVSSVPIDGMWVGIEKRNNLKSI